MVSRPQHRHRQRVEGIAEDDALIRFERKMQNKYRITKHPLTSPTLILRAQFCMECDSENPVSLQVWNTNSILVQGSPNIPKSGFDSESEIIMKMAEESIETTPDPSDTPFKLRAETMLDYVKRLDERNEMDRMVIVSLGDILLDLLLCHKIDSLGMPRGIVDAYFPTKISEINKIETVYRDDELIRLHKLRNQIAHGGSMITESEATWAKRLIEDVIEHI